MTNLINQTCPPIKLWYQWGKVPAIVNYFGWLQTYWQSKYFDFVFKIINGQVATGTAAGEMSIYNSTTDYLFFYAKNVLGVKTAPKVLLGAITYDAGFKYDASTTIYDAVPTVVATQAQFKTLLTWIFDWSELNWNIPALYQLIKKFTGLNMSQISIVQAADTVSLDTFTITMPNTAGSLLFQSFMLFYQTTMMLPFGATFIVSLT